MIELIGSVVLRKELMITRYDTESDSDDNKFFHENFFLNKKRRLHSVYCESYRTVNDRNILRSSFPDFGTSSRITNTLLLDYDREDRAGRSREGGI